MNKKIFSVVQQLPQGIVLLFLLSGTIVLDGILYSFVNTCPACTSFSQFLTMPQALSSSTLASLAALFSLTIKRK